MKGSQSGEAPGAGVLHAVDPAGPPQCLVVMYHYVRARDPLQRHAIAGLTPEEFAAQLDGLARVMEPIDWPMLFAALEGRKALPRRCFLLTFDDGLSDHAQHAAPILAARGLRGVFFVPGAVLTGQRMLAAHAVHLLLANLGVEPLRAEVAAWLYEHAGGEKKAWHVDEFAARRLYHYEHPTLAHFKYLMHVVLPREVRDRCLEELFARHVGASARWARQWYLQWDDLKELESAGHAVGGHGFDHESYRRMSPAAAASDIARSALVLREGLGPDLRPFAYPFGSATPEAQIACRDAGFAHAFTTESRCAGPGDDPHLLPRVDTIHVGSHVKEASLCPVAP